MELANKILMYKNDRKSLILVLKNTYSEVGMNFTYTENGEILDDICPFTVFGSFNKGIKDDNRIAILKQFKSQMEIQEDVPTSFDGIPVLNNMKAWFFGYKTERGEEDINNLWEMFEIAIKYSDITTEENKKIFINIYNKVITQKGVKWNLSMGLYWIRPYTYLNLDDRNRKYIMSEENLQDYLAKTDKKVPDANKYLFICEQCTMAIQKGNFGYQNLPELSYVAWKSTIESSKISRASFLQWFAPLIDAIKELGGSGTPKDVRDRIAKDLKLSEQQITETRGKTNTNKFANEVAFARNYLAYEGIIDKSKRGIWTLTEKGMTYEMTDKAASDIFNKWVVILKNKRDENEDNDKHYWIYAAGENSRLWDEFYNAGIMGIGWDELGELASYPSREEMRLSLQLHYGQDKSHKNDSLATWQFAKELNIGDIVYVKRGLSVIVGRGVVESDYIFDSSREEYKNIRKVNWTNNGKWEHPGQAVMKALTDITQYTEYIQKLELLFAEDKGTEVIEDKEIKYPKYTEEDFLSEVFMDEEQYEELSRLLLKKKNLILQGAPGVGKTFTARRLAYSIMKEKDKSRVMMVQFHQSYSYEDFIMGYRPTKDGFELSAGPFYEFCKRAQDDTEREYFFIIDEINRGNLSKIFGELLMLIETDKRGDSLRLLYSNELFKVPKNVYIIGMMNTADRSLAIIDYALRRRFAFYELKPSFDSEGFDNIREIAANSKFNFLIEKVKELNEFIKKDAALGSGFQIGHSYFCTSEEISDQEIYGIVNYELVPLINEYWFDEQSKVEKWTNILCGVMNDKN